VKRRKCGNQKGREDNNQGVVIKGPRGGSRNKGSLRGLVFRYRLDIKRGAHSDQKKWTSPEQVS